MITIQVHRENSLPHQLDPNRNREAMLLSLSSVDVALLTDVSVFFPDPVQTGHFLPANSGRKHPNLV